MKWRTEVAVPSGKNPISYSSRVLLLGSCFATHLSDKFTYFQFPHLGNPFGVLFHPVPMENLIRRAVEGRLFTPEDLIETEGRWRCLEAHSDLSGASPEEALQQLNHGLLALKEAVENATHTLLTLGTAYAFRHLPSGHLVANCHKLPASKFNRELSTPREIQDSLSRTLGLLRSAQKGMSCLLTVSPVRHLRDGLVENQRSKAHLITAVQALAEGGEAEYFPSYELFMDDLRDYRFYEPDLVHPARAGVDYVWERFEQAWIDTESRPVMKEVAAVQKGLGHRPLHGRSPEFESFRASLQARIDRLRERYPHMDFGKLGEI